MGKMLILPSAGLMLLLIAEVRADLSDVNPFIGTDGVGHSFPAATCPFGLVQAGPDTGWGTWAYCSGYQYADRRITMFSQTHNSGGGCPDYGDLGIMPFVGSKEDVSSTYDKTIESAHPSYYTVTLDRGGIRVEASATEHVALYRIDYGTNRTGRLLVDLDYGMGNPKEAGWGIKTVTPLEVSWRNGNELRGHVLRDGFIPSRHIGFDFRFDPAPKAIEEWPHHAEGVHAPRYVLDFDLSDRKPVCIRIGISTVDGDGASRNVDAEASEGDFAVARIRTEMKWRTLLSRVRVEGADGDSLTKFYTALYRVFPQPANITDADGRYRGGDGRVAKAEQGPYYSTFALWDTFRAAHPLYTLLAPEKVPHFVNSLVVHQRAVGYLPVLPKWGKDTQCMIATHAVSVIVEAYRKGLREGVDWEAAYAAIRSTLRERHPERLKEDWDVLDRYGYYPFDKVNGEAVSRTLECSYDDWCASRLAEALGKKEDAAFFLRRSMSWTNVLDRAQGFVQGRDSNGGWRDPFDPFKFGHGAGDHGDFTEGNAWQWTWHVLQDPAALVAALGGRARCAELLDGLFRAPEDRSKAPPDVTGLIGQYVQGNEPSHHIPYLYRYTERPWRTDERIREICERFYTSSPDGICGNEDHGQMSAWYVFACLGFYPVNPASGEYVLGAPQVPRATLNLANGKTFTITARNLSKKNKYVKSVALNGRPVTDWKIRHADIMAGGNLDFEMCANAETYENPIIREDFPDPTFWPGDDGWVYGTATGLKTIRRSRNLVDWEDTHVPQIATEDVASLEMFSRQFWAPDVIKIGNRYLLYVTQFVNSDSNRLVCCESATPGGPFRFRSVVVESWKIGKRDCAIDPDVVRDQDGLWLFIGSVAGGIWRTCLTSDGLALDPGRGFEHVAGLIPASDDRPWIYSHRCYEGSYLYRRNGWWYLFVSCGAIDDGTYKLCVGRSRALDGAFMDRKSVRMTDGGGELLLSTISGTDFSGAGHNGEIFTDSSGRTYMFIHSQWKGCVRPGVKWPNGPRCVSLQEVHWDKEGWPCFETGALLKQERKPDFRKSVGTHPAKRP